jgi:Ran GTPase-activating protein (RanGAP) involved in mRNA processing and transport
MAKKPAYTAKDWEKLVNDGTNYGDVGDEFTPKQRTLFECIKDKKVLKVQDAYAFSKQGKKEENHAIELAELIASFEPIDKVTSFIITHNGLTPEALQILIDSDYVQDIEYLQLGSNELGDEGVKLIANTEKFRNVHTLNLECNGVGPEGAKALAASPYLHKIDYLSLVDNRVGEEGAYAIANADNLASLTYLHLGGNRIKSEDAKEAVRQSKKLVNMKTLKIF